MKRLKGLYKDSLPIDQPEGTYRHADNINLNMDIGSMTTEEGLEALNLTLPTGFFPLHYSITPDKRIVVFYVTDSSSGIGIIDDTFSSVLEDADLSFTKNSEIHSTIKVNNQNEALVYWTDNINPPRVYNVDTSESYSDINELNIFDFISSAGTIDLESVEETGGNLYSGSYVFAMRYVDEDDNASNFFTVTRPISIVPNPVSGFVQGSNTIRTSKTIRVAMENLDTSYKEVEVAVIRFEGNTIAETTLLPSLPIFNTNQVLSYSGYSGIDISLEEITINKVAYTKAKTLGQLDNVLYMGNLTRDSEVDYQKYANNIKTYCTSKSITSPDSDGFQEDEEFVFYNKSFRRGEVYAFYISFILNDGTETEAFHIPGREAVTGEKDTVTDPIGLRINSDAKFFQLFPNADPTYNMAYWENDINAVGGAYPDNEKFDVYDIDASGNDVLQGTLRNSAVRHHRFPDEFNEPVITPTTNPYTTNYNILGVRFTDVKIPPAIKDKVKGVKFYYAQKNDSNRLNLDEGFAIPQVATANSQWNAIADTEETVYRNKNITDNLGSYTDAILSLSPFSSMLSRDSISGVDYMIQTRRCKATYGKKIRDPDTSFILNNAVANTPAARANKLVDVEALSYYEDNLVTINTSAVGFTNNKSSYLEHSGILIKGYNSVPMNFNADLSAVTAGNGTTLDVEFGAIYKMCSFKETVHSPFSQETLCSLGKVDTDLTNFDPTNVGATFQSNTFYTGDTFISNYSEFISMDRTEGGEELDLSIIHTIVQSYDHANWRQAGQDQYDFNPNNKTLEEEIIDYYRTTGQDVFYDNFYGYDSAHSVQAYLKSTPPDQAEDLVQSSIPTRIIRSAEENFDTQEDNFRRFLENDYLDISSNRGQINKISTNNGLLLIHTENALFRTRGKEEFVTGDFRTFLGSGDIFEIQPTELYNTKNGFAGIQDTRSAIETKDGYFFVDSDNKRVYLMRDKIEDLTEKGMRNFFKDNLTWFIDEAQDHKDIPYTGIISEYDNEYNRILLTKVDYKPTQTLLDALGSTISFNSTTGKFNDGTDIEYTNQTYFEDKSFTISYLPSIGAWVSFHDYKPLFYMSDGLETFSFNNGFYQHNSKTANFTDFYGTQYGIRLQVVDNPEQTLTKHLVNVEFITHVHDADTEKPVWNKTFDRIRVRNDIQDTDIQDLIYFTNVDGNLRKVEGTWRVNKFRDLINPDTGNLDPTLEWHRKKRLIGKYALIDVYYDTPGRDKLSLTDIKTNFKQSIR